MKSKAKKTIPAKVASKALKKVPLPAKAPPPVKKAAPVQKAVKQAKATEPEDTGKGVAAAVSMHSDRNRATDLPDENTPADQKRRMDAAKDKAKAAVMELPMTPEHRLVLQSTKLGEDARVMRYHDSTQWASCLMWLTHIEKEAPEVPGKKDKKAPPVMVKVVEAIHVIRTQPDGTLGYEKLRPDQAMYFAEIQGGYPIVPAIYHFRKHADTNGASAKVRELLGMSKDAPAKTIKVVERNEEDGKPTGRVIEVVKPPKGGNSNKPTQNDDLDELYKRAARLLQIKEPDLRQKYSHLNNGLQAMNLRNRLRAKGHNV